MGWLYPVKFSATDGTTRDVLIPNLQSLNGRQIWTVMKRAVNRAAGSNMDEKTKESVKRVDELIDLGKFSLLNFDSEEKREIEKALADIAAQIEEHEYIGVNERR